MKKYTQKKFLEFLVLEITTQSAADLLEMNPNSAELFYCKVREVISYHLAVEANGVFDGKIELEATLVDKVRENEVVVWQENWLF